MQFQFVFASVEVSCLFLEGKNSKQNKPDKDLRKFALLSGHCLQQQTGHFFCLSTFPVFLIWLYFYLNLKLCSSNDLKECETLFSWKDFSLSTNSQKPSPTYLIKIASSSTTFWKKKKILISPNNFILT